MVTNERNPDPLREFIDSFRKVEETLTLNFAYLVPKGCSKEVVDAARDTMKAMYENCPETTRALEDIYSDLVTLAEAGATLTRRHLHGMIYVCAKALLDARPNLPLHDRAKAVQVAYAEESDDDDEI